MVDVVYWIEQIGLGMALAGAILSVVGSLGVLRFGDLYTRLHAASITDTGGATLMLLGLALTAGLSQEAMKLVIAWAFVMLTSPTASHALANAAWSSGHKPKQSLMGDDEREPRRDLGELNLKAPLKKEGEPS